MSQTMHTPLPSCSFESSFVFANVSGRDPALIGKTYAAVGGRSYPITFRDNSAMGSWRMGLDFAYQGELSLLCHDEAHLLCQGRLTLHKVCPL